MKQFLFISLLLTLLGCNSEVKNDTLEDRQQYKNNKVYTLPLNQFQSVWNEVKSDPVTTLPQETLSYSKLFDGAINLILKDAKRTLVDTADMLTPFDKLAHPNGVCMKGIWEIDTNSTYSGYFKYGSKSLIIGRASSAMSNTKRGENRAFGMAGKLFPTQDKMEIQTVPSANFFVIDDLGGTDADYFTDVELTNEPDVSFTATVLGSIAYSLKVVSAFSDADSNPGIRQLYEISYLGESNSSQVITPKWMKISAQDGQTAYGVTDFRDEFTLDTNGTIIFNIFVASLEVDNIKQWLKIGKITFDESVVSYTCDHRLHFHHPLWRDDLIYE